jgi:hypothetical protein
MSKILLALMIVLGVTSLVYAAPKWVPMTITSDTTVQIGPGRVVDANFYWNGVTAGNSMVIKNSDTIGVASDAVFTIIADTTAGSRQMSALQKDLVVDKGIYVDVTKSAGTFGVELFYQ